MVFARERFVCPAYMSFRTCLNPSKLPVGKTQTFHAPNVRDAVRKESESSTNKPIPRRFKSRICQSFDDMKEVDPSNPLVGKHLTSNALFNPMVVPSWLRTPDPAPNQSQRPGMHSNQSLAAPDRQANSQPLPAGSSANAAGARDGKEDQSSGSQKAAERIREAGEKGSSQDKPPQATYEFEGWEESGLIERDALHITPFSRTGVR
ncbi:hypothetical protein EJ03DRAFT_75811 [Teratosphaeria nubilosa]|uniref:Uncharacterized protein n=1 Tax=Teratosphaeria nubilosa TaxID=161662 RepID=A0A6G1LNT0_9PEZI|nr:hypothetical protein EJ03DRAFT_75811 [Teratosphaeria nubilosa]